MSHKAKARRSVANKTYYQGMKDKVKARKEKRIKKAAARKAYWVKRGVKRNGKPVRVAA